MATGNDLPTLDERAGEGESLPVMDTHFPTRADFLKKKKIKLKEILL